MGKGGLRFKVQTTGLGLSVLELVKDGGKSQIEFLLPNGCRIEVESPQPRPVFWRGEDLERIAGTAAAWLYSC